MASAALKLRLRFTSWCPVYVRSCWAVHLGPAVPREVLHMNTQHWQLYVTQTAQRAAMTKQGSCAFPPHSSGLLHEHRSTPGRPSTTSPYGRHTSQLALFTMTQRILRQSSCLCHCLLAVLCDYIQKSSDFSRQGWSRYAKCYCQGQLALGQLHGCSYLGLNSRQSIEFRAD